MPRAVVFINTTVNTDDVVKSLEKVEGVSEAYSSRGMYDAVAMIEAENFNKMKQIISQKIQNLDHVKSTLTLTLIEKPIT